MESLFEFLPILTEFWSNTARESVFILGSAASIAVVLWAIGRVIFRYIQNKLALRSIMAARKQIARITAEYQLVKAMKDSFENSILFGFYEFGFVLFLIIIFSIIDAITLGIFGNLLSLPILISLLIRTLKNLRIFNGLREFDTFRKKTYSSLAKLLEKINASQADVEKIILDLKPINSALEDSSEKQ
ncbi:MAG: hypothetical protein IIA14_01845 [SAR324 cluster bacterium]|nr:hypothetical protein [SAR324 cluster bacterium]